MKSLFSWITRLSVRFRYVTLVIAAIVAVLGVVAVTQLQQELLPPIEVPQSVILAQVSGMSSDEVLTVLTTRMEDALLGVEDVINVESTTTSAIGAVLVARNDFGIDQDALHDDIRAALNEVWLPLRRIQAPAGEDPADFAARLLHEVSADVLIYLAEHDSNFIFQLTPDVWAALSDETVNGVLAYMADQTEALGSADSALRQLVNQQIIPELEALDLVADISVSGGQALPGENNGNATTTPITTEVEPLVLGLSSDVWSVLTGRFPDLGAQDASAAAALDTGNYTIPATPPDLPVAWQMDRFVTAQDLMEMRTLTRSTAGVFNSFLETGEIVGALGQTDDLTPEIITQMLAIEPAMVNHFEAEHLVAMSADVFAALPEDYITGLDGFTRDALAAAALAESITGTTVEPEPVDLPSAWQLSPPALISFSFDDLPLASFSIFGGANVSTDGGTEVAANPGDESANPDGTADGSANGTPMPPADVPEGPALPGFFALIGLQFGVELNTA
ncbi:MAG: efflux RND transporter permease subunit, partial [Anaerolineae bacterium]|nr:efflux RND transporter permease subunit [Anaerolineae bacterium]